MDTWCIARLISASLSLKQHALSWGQAVGRHFLFFSFFGKRYICNITQESKL
jgi:hypothetical protein